MTATEIIAEIKKLPETERDKVLTWMFEASDEEVFDFFDRMPRKCTMSEEEILALPRRAGAVRR